MRASTISVATQLEVDSQIDGVNRSFSDGRVINLRHELHG